MKLLILTSLMLSPFSQVGFQISSLEKMEEEKEFLKSQKIVWLACHFQLQSKIFPKHCFEIQSLYKQFQGYFDDQCQKASWKSLYEMSQLIKNKALHPSCLEKIEQSKKIYLYKQAHSSFYLKTKIRKAVSLD